VPYVNRNRKNGKTKAPEERHLKVQTKIPKLIGEVFDGSDSDQITAKPNAK